VAEHHPTRPESLQPYTERSSRSDSEPPSVEADVYVWRYSVLIVHARKEEEIYTPKIVQFRSYCLDTHTDTDCSTWTTKVFDSEGPVTHTSVTVLLLWIPVLRTFLMNDFQWVNAYHSSCGQNGVMYGTPNVLL